LHAIWLKVNDLFFNPARGYLYILKYLFVLLIFHKSTTPNLRLTGNNVSVSKFSGSLLNGLIVFSSNSSIEASSMLTISVFIILF